MKQNLLQIMNLATESYKLTNLNQLKQLHAHIIRNFLHHQNKYVSLLIAHCISLNAPPLYVRLIFNSTPAPNAQLFTHIIDYYTQLGCHFQTVLQLHAYVFKRGQQHDKYLQNVIMGGYGRCFRYLVLARRMFDEMPEPTVADWNSMISIYWKWGFEGEVVKMFDVMNVRNVVTWTAMVSGYVRMKDLVSARRYFDAMPERNVVSWNAMLSGYAKNGFVQEGLELFCEMIDGGVEPSETTWVVVFSMCSSYGDAFLADSLVKMLVEKRVQWNYYLKTAVLDMYAKCGSVEKAKRMFDDLGEYRNVVAWNAMISAYTRVGDLRAGRELFDQMPRRDVVSWNSVISGYAQNGQSAMAIELFKEMIAVKEVIPDEVTMVNVISACGHLGALELGNWAANFAVENKIKLSDSGYNSLIFMYSKCGSMQDAKRVFQEMKARDVVSYNTLIAGLAAHGHGKEVIELMSKMRQEGLELDRITYIGVLTACSHAGLLEEGWKVFKSIENPTVDHYACMVDLLGRVGQLDEAKMLIDSMPMEPHGGVYGSLLNASRIHKRVDLGELAANQLFELEPTNSGNYILLSNIYASAGRWDDVNRIREAMKERGVQKTTAWSLVEYKGEMHKFTVGDRRHELSDEIYKLLSKLQSSIRKFGYGFNKSCVLRDVEEEEKEDMVGTHSEKLAICFALLVREPNTVIRVVKNLRICEDCHSAIKIISKLEGREIIVRDNNRFHCFVDGSCSCNDYW